MIKKVKTIKRAKIIKKAKASKSRERKRSPRTITDLDTIGLLS